MQLTDTHALAVFVRQRRTELGLTQAQLADKVGVGREWVVRLEKGHPRLEVGMVLGALRALDSVPEVGHKVTLPARVESDTSPVAQVLGNLSQRQSLHDRLRASSAALASDSEAVELMRRSAGDRASSESRASAKDQEQE